MLNLVDAEITDIDGKTRVNEVELLDYIDKPKAWYRTYTEPDADNEKKESFGVMAEIISLSPVAMGVGAKKSNVNSVVDPTVSWVEGLTPAIDFVLTVSIMHVVLSISAYVYVNVVITIE